jgi:hypothetical protein
VAKAPLYSERGFLTVGVSIVSGEEIIRQEYAEQKHRNLDAEQLALELEDPILF